MITPVILCGGAGSRLWPLSRERYPKQILALDGEESLLQATVRRARHVAPDARPVVVCNEEHRFLVAEQLRALGVQARIILEPEGRNTAPALLLAALLGEVPADAPMLVLPADHMVGDLEAFASAVSVAARAAAGGALVTFGVVPDSPHTGYGYIRRGEARGEAFEVDRFVEKPDAETASGYLEAGGYLWNSGMFLFPSAAYIREIEAHRPEMLDACRVAAKGAKTDLDFVRPDKTAFLKCPSDSIDYAVMEKTRDAVVVPLDSGWSDVGSWTALHEVLPSDAKGNTVVGDVLMADCEDSLLYSTSRLVAGVGLRGYAVIESPDAVLVLPLSASQDVKRIVEQLKAGDRSESHLHRQVFRPWGSYDSVDHGPRFQVKRLIVNPGAQLSLQMHNHRAEHWVVVQGTARITRDDEVFDLHENESTYIPLGAKHRIENPTDEPLHIIEVQSGAYLGEDDIVRFEDVYGRAQSGSDRT